MQDFNVYVHFPENLVAGPLEPDLDKVQKRLGTREYRPEVGRDERG